MRNIADTKMSWQINSLMVPYSCVVFNRELTRIWSPKLLLPLGKITMIKSLLKAKFVHIKLSLPSPKYKTLSK